MCGGPRELFGYFLPGGAKGMYIGNERKKAVDLLAFNPGISEGTANVTALQIHRKRAYFVYAPKQCRFFIMVHKNICFDIVLGYR